MKQQHLFVYVWFCEDIRCDQSDLPDLFKSSSIPLSPALVTDEERELWVLEGESQRFFERNKLLENTKMKRV